MAFDSNYTDRSGEVVYGPASGNRGLMPNSGDVEYNPTIRLKLGDTVVLQNRNAGGYCNAGQGSYERTVRLAVLNERNCALALKNSS